MRVFVVASALSSVVQASKIKPVALDKIVAKYKRGELARSVN